MLFNSTNVIISANGGELSIVQMPEFTELFQGTVQGAAEFMKKHNITSWMNSSSMDFGAEYGFGQDNVTDLLREAVLNVHSPDWEGFGKAIMNYWPEGDVDGFQLQELAEKYHLIKEVEGGFNPEIHADLFGCAEPGDSWFMLNFTKDQQQEAA